MKHIKAEYNINNNNITLIKENFKLEISEDEAIYLMNWIEKILLHKTEWRETLIKRIVHLQNIIDKENL
jgi:transcriptional regulatory protein LevR